MVVDNGQACIDHSLRGGAFAAHTAIVAIRSSACHPPLPLVYPTTRLLASELGVTRSRLLECIDHTLDAFYVSVVLVCFDGFSRPLTSGFECGCGPLAAVGAIVDATALARQRIADKAESKKFYHKKASTKHAAKVQITVTLKGFVLHVSHVVHGSMHDVTLLDKSDVLDDVPLAYRLLGDKGYVGRDRVVTPKRKPRGGELTPEEKKDDKEKNSATVVVENCIRKFKRWAIVGSVYRGQWRHDVGFGKLTKIVRVIGAMVKRAIERHPLRPHHPAESDSN
jgi:hypothetical protein